MTEPAIDTPSASRANGWRIGVDIGGTFTDLVAVSPVGSISVFKVPSVPADPGAGVLAALECAAQSVDLTVSEFLAGTALFACRTSCAAVAWMDQRRVVDTGSSRGRVARRNLTKTGSCSGTARNRRMTSIEHVIRRGSTCAVFAQNEMGWLMGFEPTTTGITIRDSTAELQPPPENDLERDEGAPDRTRTCYRRLRRPVLYPDELRALRAGPRGVSGQRAFGCRGRGGEI